MWIYEHKDWPNFIWDEKALSVLLAQARHRQGRLLGRMDALGFPIRQEASLNMLTMEVVTSSAIEGEKLDTAEVRSSIARRLGIPTHDNKPVSRNVEGIVEMMLDATQKFDRALTAERLFGWHAALFPTGRSGMHRIIVGAWRSEEAGPMQVVSGPVGREIVHFEAPEAQRLEDEMVRFLTWFETDQALDPVIRAGIAHFWFVTIHPFEDGNGRIARAISDMMLARADGTSSRFYSMSRQIEQERKAYYTQLEHQQKAGVDITAWLSWFLSCLVHAIDNAEEKLTSVLFKAELWSRINPDPVNERQRLIINRMLEDFKGYMTTSKYAKLAKCSPDTALRDMRELVSRHILIQNPGRGRSTSYRLITAEELGQFDLL